jgi:methionyl-tRNA synthetase
MHCCAVPILLSQAGLALPWTGSASTWLILQDVFFTKSLALMMEEMTPSLHDGGDDTLFA